MSFPQQLNLGSGKNFKDDCLNLDIDSYWKPDLIHDLNIPLPFGHIQKFKTERFGEIEIKSNTFEKIIAFDVLEHISHLAVCMKSCLNLLQEDGLLEVMVPYDLSLGAWQDPTHVRAFNENSWLYYTDWFWYMGWTQHRFTTEKLTFKLSHLGNKLRKEGKELQEIARIPRAVDAEFVQLKKVPLSEQDYLKLEHYSGKSKS